MNHRRMKDFTVVETRKKIWDFFGWGYLGQKNRLWKNHQLTCGCKICRLESFLKRHENRQNRYKAKLELRKELGEKL